MEGCFTFQWGQFVFQMGDFIFKWEGAPRGHQWWGEVFKKNGKMRGTHPMPHPHYGKPCVLILNFCFAYSLLLCMFSACMFCFTNITNV